MAEAGRGQERAPLTRLRASVRPVTAVLTDGLPSSRALLPGADVWSALLGESDLPQIQVDALSAIARGRRLLPGATVFSHSDRPAGLLLVSEGDVALGVLTEDGGFRTERHMHGPAWVDISTGLLQGSYACDARAMTASTLVELPRQAVLEVMECYPAIARWLLMAVAREARELALSTHDLMHKDAPARLAAWLHGRCQLSEDGAAGVVQLPMRKRDIASQLAITPETLSRLMRTFSSQGMLQVAGYTVHVLDPAALQRLAGVRA